MANAVCMSGMCQCTFGAAPGNLVVTPENRVMLENKPCANIMDNKPMVNILPFGMCSSMSNPSVASATSAALGVLTPMPCIPSIAGPWMSGSSTVMVGGKPALNNTSKLTCVYGGVISLTNPGQMKVMIP